MHTARLGNCMCFSFSGNRQMSLPGGPPNEQVWVGLQWSPPDVTSRGPQVWLPRGVCYMTFAGRGTLAYVLCHDTFDVTYPPTPATDGGRYLWKHYLPTTSFAGGKNPVNTEINRFNYCVFPFISLFYVFLGRILDQLIEPAQIRLPLENPDRAQVHSVSCGRAHTVIHTSEAGWYQ